MSISYLNASLPYGLQPLPESARVHPRGRTYSPKILIVVKQEFFRYTAIAQRPADPLFQSPGDYGPPQAFLGSRSIHMIRSRAFKHT
jgi:hypothetical protein